MWLEVECVHRGVGDFQSDRVVAGLEDGVHSQAARGCGSAYEGKQRVPASQRQLAQLRLI